MTLHNSSMPQPIDLRELAGATGDSLHLALIGIIQDTVIREVAHQLKTAVEIHSPDDLDLLSKERMQHVFDISSRTLQKWVRFVPDFPKPMRLVGRLYWRREDIRAFITARKGLTVRKQIGLGGKGPQDERIK